MTENTTFETETNIQYLAIERKKLCSCIYRMNPRLSAVKYKFQTDNVCPQFLFFPYQTSHCAIVPEEETWSQFSMSVHFVCHIFHQFKLFYFCLAGNQWYFSWWDGLGKDCAVHCLPLLFGRGVFLSNNKMPDEWLLGLICDWVSRLPLELEVGVDYTES